MGVILRDREGWLYLDIYLNGFRKKVALGTKDRTIGEQIRKTVEAEIVLGRFNLNQAKKKVVNLNDYLDRYFLFASSFKKDSVIRNEKHYAKHFLEFARKTRTLRQLTPELLDQWKVKVLSHYSPTTFNMMRRFLHAAMNVAVKWGELEKNPVTALQKMRVEEKRIYLTMDEFKKVLEVLDSDIANPKKKWLRKFNVRYRMFLELMYLTGMRRQEALSLTPDRIDFANAVIYLEKTKNKTFRAIPMHPRVKEILQSVGEKVFAEFPHSSASHKFHNLTGRAGIRKGFKLHSLRHTFATNLVSKGVDISVIQSLLGHADIRTTLIYSKTTLEAMRMNIVKLDLPE